MRVDRILAFLLLAAPATALELPDPAALLVAAFTAPAKGYTAHGRIQSFAPGRKPKALGMTVYYLPDGRLRREVRAHAGAEPEQVFIDDGTRQRLYWPKLGTLWTGRSADDDAASRAARLRALYAVSVSTGGRVAGRATWRLNLTAPDGGLRRALWVARDGGLLLKCEEYRLDGTLLRRERLTALVELNPDPALFRLEVPPGTPEAPMTAPRGAAEPGAVSPRWIPDGFLALESRVEKSGGGRVSAVGYGDGVETFTIRQNLDTEEPGGGERSGRPVLLMDGRRAFLSSGRDGPVLAFRSGQSSFSITGEITEDEMVRVADSFAAARP
ncbi:MAG: hypothetical protein ACHQ49_09655 [Elusimicrobiota bacterium]